MSRRGIATAVLTVLALAPVPPLAALDVPQGAGARVQHHLREIAPIMAHFDSVLASDCPRFSTHAEWRAYLDDEIDRVVLLVAHLEQAWIEAKQAPDDDTRRVAKAPRRQLDRARMLVDKLQACADQNGANFAPQAVWRRIEREVPQRQMEIALPR